MTPSDNSSYEIFDDLIRFFFLSNSKSLEGNIPYYWEPKFTVSWHIYWFLLIGDGFIQYLSIRVMLWGHVPTMGHVYVPVVGAGICVAVLVVGWDETVKQVRCGQSFAERLKCVNQGFSKFSSLWPIL